MTAQSPVTILMVEDDAGHARLTERSLRRAQVTHDIVVISDGQDAIDYLMRELESSESADKATFLVLLGVHLQGLDGLQVLARLREDTRTAQLPVIMLSVVETPEETDCCTALGCQGVLSKPVTSEQWMDVMLDAGLVATR